MPATSASLHNPFFKLNCTAYAPSGVVAARDNVTTTRRVLYTALRFYDAAITAWRTAFAVYGDTLARTAAITVADNDMDTAYATAFAANVAFEAAEVAAIAADKAAEEAFITAAIATIAADEAAEAAAANTF